MKDRISKILREEGMTAAKFADEIGVQASGISHILSGRNNPSTDFLIKILERFRGINAEWLLLGKGNMYKSGSSQTQEIEESSQKHAGNDLFSPTLNNSASNSTPLKDLNIEESIKKPIETSATEPLKPEHEIPKSIEEPKVYERPVNDKRVEKIVMFFNDNTFESYNPNK